MTARERRTTEERVREAVARATGRGDLAGAPVRRLAGHASMRSYWRVGTFAPGPPSSHVVMVMPPDPRPEEVTKGGAPGVDPFVDVQGFLRRLGVRVPEIVAFYRDDPEGGLMVLEDLGDETLEARLLSGGAGGRPASSWEGLYRIAVENLARLREAAARSPERCVAHTRSFDLDLYRWELDHFREWLLEAWKGARLSPAERGVVDREFDRLARRLAAEPPGFTHRDYQSRNLMVLPSGELAVIDFQDALLGPAAYDLVALLRDSYVELPDDLVERSLLHYLASGGGGAGVPYPALREVFDRLTVQRKLKDAGRFVYIDRVKGNPGFLRSIPASLRYVRQAFARLPDLRELQEVLARHVPELAP
ncbi:MAG TPA: phosphotransferase [Anaeromyxobacteraceae bacterium]|nr:phosphotransferase [Anaeromyxobacteraceae bacterium]